MRKIIVKHLAGKKGVFMHVPKTAGSSVRKFAIENNIVIIGHNLRDENYETLYSYKARRNVSFSFAFVRNPWDRLVSSYFYLQKGGGNAGDLQDKKKLLNDDMLSDFSFFVKKGLIQKNILKQMHFREQFSWFYNGENCLVDKIYKFEKLQEAIREICTLGNYPHYELPLTNTSNHSHYTEYYDNETRKIVSDIYKKDIELFNYSFE